MLQPPSAIEAISPLLRLVNERQDLYFQLYSFVHKNIQCSSNDLDNTTLFKQFLPPFKFTHSSLKDQEQKLLAELGDLWEQSQVDASSKDLVRLSNRIYQRLEASASRIRKGLFDEGGRSARQLLRFKTNLHKIIKKQPFLLTDYAQCVIHYTNSKFTRQLSKIQRYLDKILQGDTVYLRDLYAKGSDVQASSPEEKEKKEKPHSKLKRPTINLKVEGHHVEQDKKSKRLKSTVKKRQKLQSTRHKPKEQSDSQDDKPNKQQTANKLLKFYEHLALSKRQFLEDYIFKEDEKQRKKVELLNKLLQRNKGINSQINGYVKKQKNIPFTIVNLPPPYFSKSSGQETSREHLTTKITEKPKQFHISRRRGSLHFQSSSGNEKMSDHEKEFNMSMPKKSLNHRKSSPSQSRTPRPQQKSRKLMIVKEQKIFDDEMIPQAQINEPHFLQLPTSLRKDRRNDLRLKRKNNPSPMENATFQHFRYNP